MLGQGHERRCDVWSSGPGSGFRCGNAGKRPSHWCSWKEKGLTRGRESGAADSCCSFAYSLRAFVRLRGSVGCVSRFKERLARALSAGGSGSRRRTSGVVYSRGVRDSERVRSEG